MWLDHVDHKIYGESISSDIYWAAYHANKPEARNVNIANNSRMMPVFKEQAHSPAMIKHFLSILNKAVKLLNQNQVPVVAFDQPLYALAKKLVDLAGMLWGK